uniref:Structural maintenance of chromosomes protein 3 n=1 Tax=Rhizophora mucronata TaxID=61149 RepID=A0A2P2MI78_RHIMU
MDLARQTSFMVSQCLLVFSCFYHPLYLLFIY